MFSLVFLAALLLISFSVGKWVLKALKIEFNTFLEQFIFATAIGLGILAYTVFFLGIFGLLYPWIIYLLLTPLFLLSLGNIKTLLSNFWLGFKNLRNLCSDNFSLIAGILLGIHLLITFICALAPVTAWDPLVLHLAVPKIYLRHHAIIFLPFRMGSNMPFLMQMLYMLGMLVCSDIAAALIHWLTGVMTLLTIFIFGRKFFSTKVGILAATIFFSCPLVTFLSTGASIDLALSFFTFLALYGFIDWLIYERRESFILSAIASGLAAGTKYTGLVPFVIILGTIAFKLLFAKKENFMKAFKKIALYGSISFLIFSPWLVKNFIYHHNPFYPFLSFLFGGRVPPTELPFLSTPSSNFFQYLFFPWNITMVGKICDDWAKSGGVFYLAFIPLFLLIREKGRIMKYFLVYFLLGMTFFYFFSQRARYMLLFFPPLALGAAYVLERLEESDIWFKKILPVFVIFALLINLGLFSGLAFIRLPVVLGLETKSDYLNRRMRTYDVIRYINENLEDSAKILFFDTRGYYCDREYIWGNIIPIREAKTKKEALVIYKEYNLTHLLVNKGEWLKKYWHKPHSELVPKHLKLLYEKNDVFLYKIKY